MRARSLVLAAFLALALPPALPGRTQEAYLDPVERDGMVFPILRTRWLSLINIAEDWHAPRMRKIGGSWVQVGIHEGNDIFAEPGTPVVAVLSGSVEQLGWTFYSGYRVGVRGDDGRYWFYAHLSSYVPGLGIGDRVEAGQPIGAVGNTGYGNAPGHRDEFIYHLHIGIQEASGTWVDPNPLMRRLYRTAVRAR
jgi:murein DD-endopeptidase MepM/ murein hydrolase activator NlpD